MGTTSYLVVWFSVLSFVSMVGVTKILVILAISAFTGIMAALTIAIKTIALHKPDPEDSIFQELFSGCAAIIAGLIIAIMLIALSGTVLLWMYGSFWTTAFFAFCGGMAFVLGHEGLALLIWTMYSAYCAWFYVGWLGLLFGLNISFIQSWTSPSHLYS